MIEILFTIYSISVADVSTKLNVEEPNRTIVMANEENDDRYGIIERQLNIRNYVNSQAENVPNYCNDCKSEVHTYMDYRKITSKTSNQWIVNYESNAYTDENGLRKVDDCYLVAIGTGYSIGVGERAYLLMEDGEIVPIIVGDIKSDADTDETNRYHAIDGSVVEYIVDTDVFTSVDDYPDEIKGKVLKIVPMECS